ncbi:RICIN domain-containing protein [Micromonospora sp. KC213]|uniref:RICIN domain-containing protein n=1 Tax=Micromonospora sp. KC213 TaxID=2530378 RepID=UPI0010498D21|nr:RICIN domain-containing protein [Micromonospora sp. KC213]TDC42647.1 alpha-L-arabinofuranosidase [Micromonospora sp. KC213]
MSRRRWRTLAAACAALLGVVYALVPVSIANAVGETSFRNPLVANGADPWLQYHNGNYYLAYTTWNNQLLMKKSPTLAALSTAAAVNIWSDTEADRCCSHWAPEFHRLTGPNGTRWYYMYTSGRDGTLDFQHLHVLESAGDDPMGPYLYRGSPMPTTWNIDGSYLQLNGQLYLMWSEWESGDQSLWIAQMSNPWTITGSKVLISRPSLSWEIQGGRTEEGPVALQRNGKTYIVYSASSCNTPDYKLGMLTLTGSNPLSPASWTKSPNPVFQAANGVYGPGHNGFFTSPDGTENWIVYHGNASSTDGCGSTRSTRAQKFTWNADDTPNFGSPVSTSTNLAVPSGEQAATTTAVRGAAYRLVNRNSALCAAVAGGSTADGGNVSQQACSGAAAEWVLDSTADGYYRLINRGSNKALDVADCGTADGTNVRQWAWLNSNCQQWQVTSTSDGWFRLQSRSSGKVLDVNGCGTSTGTNIQLWTSLNNNCQQWRLQPVGTVAIASMQSGKVVDVANCATANGSNVQQWGYLGTACQKWTFTHTDSGYYRIVPTHATSSCLVVAGASTADGANVEQNACSGTNSQWRVEPLADGSVRLVARHSGRALDLADCGLPNGTNVQQWSWLDNICQRFHLMPV